MYARLPSRQPRPRRMIRGLPRPTGRAQRRASSAGTDAAWLPGNEWLSWTAELPSKMTHLRCSMRRRSQAAARSAHSRATWAGVRPGRQRTAQTVRRAAFVVPLATHRPPGAATGVAEAARSRCSHGRCRHLLVDDEAVGAIDMVDSGVRRRPHERTTTCDSSGGPGGGSTRARGSLASTAPT